MPLTAAAVQRRASPLRPQRLRKVALGLNASIDAGSLEQVITMEDRNQILCAQAADFREGIAAFLQKRVPEYTES